MATRKKPARKGKTTRKATSAKRKSRKRKPAIGAIPGLGAQVQRLQSTITAAERITTRIEKAAKAHDAANRKQELLNNSMAKLVGKGARKRKPSTAGNVRHLYAA